MVSRTHFNVLPKVWRIQLSEFSVFVLTELFWRSVFALPKLWGEKNFFFRKKSHADHTRMQLFSSTTDLTTPFHSASALPTSSDFESERWWRLCKGCLSLRCVLPGRATRCVWCRVCSTLRRTFLLLECSFGRRNSYSREQFECVRSVPFAYLPCVRRHTRTFAALSPPLTR